MTAVLAALVVVQTPASVLDASYRAHAKLPNVHAVIAIEETSPSTPAQQRKFTLHANGQSVYVRIEEPARKGFERSDRRFLLKGQTLTGYDAVANERLTRSAYGPDRAARLESSLGGLEESAGLLLSPSRLKKFYANLEQRQGWKVFSNASIIKLVQGNPAAGQIEIAVGAKDRLLRSLLMKQGATSLKWSIQYLRAGNVALSIPSNARGVASFTVPDAPPIFMGKAAETVYRGMLTASGAISSGTVLVDGAAKYRTVFNRNAVRQELPSSVWLYDGANLFILNRATNTFYRGAARRSDVIDLVVKAGAKVEPFTRDVVLRRPPFRTILDAGSKVGIVGTMRTSGIAMTLLRASTLRKRVSMSVRQDLKLPASISVDMLDASGKVISSSATTYNYARLNKAQNAADLKLSAPAGAKVVALPKL